jgi:hypothetical protein
MNGSENALNLNGMSSYGMNVKREENEHSICESAASTSIKPEPQTTAAENRKPEPNVDEKASKSSAETMDEKPHLPPVKKVFTVEELTEALLPVWESLEAVEDAVPFRIPVDPIMLGIPVSIFIFGDTKKSYSVFRNISILSRIRWTYRRLGKSCSRAATKIRGSFATTCGSCSRTLGRSIERRQKFTNTALR